MTLLTPDEVAQKLQVHRNTLANWRSKGVGPTYTRIGGAIRYTDEAVLAYVSARLFLPPEQMRGV
jgi:predicted site-specific integrase-resolvase